MKKIFFLKAVVLGILIAFTPKAMADDLGQLNCDKLAGGIWIYNFELDRQQKSHDQLSSKVDDYNDRFLGGYIYSSEIQDLEKQMAWIDGEILAIGGKSQELVDERNKRCLGRSAVSSLSGEKKGVQASIASKGSQESTAEKSLSGN